MIEKLVPMLKSLNGNTAMWTSNNCFTCFSIGARHAGNLGTFDCWLPQRSEQFDSIHLNFFCAWKWPPMFGVQD